MLKKIGHMGRVLACVCCLTSMAGVVAAMDATTISLTHPRLFITPDNRQALRGRMAGPLKSAFDLLIASDHVKIKNTLEGIRDHIYKEAFIYQMTDDDRYAQNTIAAMYKVAQWDNAYYAAGTGRHATAMEALAIGFDWVYDRLSQDQKSYFIDLINSLQDKNISDIMATPDYHNYGTAAWVGMAISGLATYGENARASEYLNLMDQIMTGLKTPKGWLNHFSSIEATDGACNWEGPTYARRSMFNIFRYAEAVNTATDGKINLWTGPLSNLENAGYYIMYMTRPDNKFEYGSDVNYPGTMYFEIQNLALLSKTFNNGYFKTFVDRYYQWDAEEFTASIWTGHYANPLTYYLLFYDPGIDSKAMAGLPMSKKFGNTIIIRSGFDADDTMITFRSGAHWGFHGQQDHGAFTIFKHQPLAIDSGWYDSWSSGLDHNWNYWKRTVAHNLLTIRKPDEVWIQWPAKIALGNDGGQRHVYCSYSPDRANAPHGSHYPMSGEDYLFEIDSFLMGEWDAYETNDSFVHIKADITNAYNNVFAGMGNNQPKKVNSASRELVFLAPDYLVVFDRVTAVDAAYEKRWLLHSGSYYDKSGMPHINGTLDVVKGVETAGIVESLDADTFTITMGKGRLFSKTLLPKERILRRIGGTGYEFFADDRNHPISKAIPADRLSDDPGAWRVEVVPVNHQADQHFLHVFKISDDTENSMDAVELIETIDSIGVSIASVGTVTFPLQAGTLATIDLGDPSNDAQPPISPGCSISDVNADGILDDRDQAYISECIEAVASSLPIEDCSRFDYTADGKIDKLDRKVYLQSGCYVSNPPQACIDTYDLNDDGIIDKHDLFLIQECYVD